MRVWENGNEVVAVGLNICTETKVFSKWHVYAKDCPLEISCFDMIKRSICAPANLLRNVPILLPGQLSGNFQEDFSFFAHCTQTTIRLWLTVGLAIPYNLWNDSRGYIDILKATWITDSLKTCSALAAAVWRMLKHHQTIEFNWSFVCLLFCHTKTQAPFSFARFVILPRIFGGRCISMRMNFPMLYFCWIRSRGQMLNKLKANRMLKARTLPSCWYFCSDKTVLLAENASTAPLWHISIGKSFYFMQFPLEVVSQFLTFRTHGPIRPREFSINAYFESIMWQPQKNSIY